MATAVAVRRPVRAVRQAQRILITRSGSRRKTKITIPLAIVAGFMPMANQAWIMASSGNASMIPALLSQSMTGWNPTTLKWDAGQMKVGLVPIAIGVGVHKLASMAGINRAIAQAGIPFFRI